ncbi:MAG: hypothetical protein HRT37_19915 [Alteromonadaceae bacterium]|nr:hypothetical protein [Alteromonadaceae bacterium]
MQYRINLIKTTTTIFDADQIASDTYVSEYDGYNSYGALTNKIEYHGASTGTATNIRYSQYGYIDDVGNGVINLPTTQKISTNENSGYETVQETLYKSTFANHSGIQLPWKQEQFGQVITEFKSYHSDGNLLRIEFNKDLLNSSGNKRFLEFSNYYRGNAQTIKMANRYNNTAQNISKTFNSFGQVESTTDLSGSTINYTYDSLGRLATVNPTDEKWADTKITWSMGTSPTRTIVK